MQSKFQANELYMQLSSPLHVSYFLSHEIKVYIYQSLLDCPFEKTVRFNKCSSTSGNEIQINRT